MVTAARRTILPTALAAVLVAAALSGCSPQQIADLLPHDAPRDEQGAITASGSTDVFDLRQGDCIEDQSLVDSLSSESGNGASQEVHDVRTVPCSDPHDFEAYRDVTLTGGSDYPGADPVDAQADEACGKGFDSFIGFDYQDSAYEYTYYQPTAEGWMTGDRTVTCLVGDPAGKTTGSLKGIGR
ncbi:septum formation family protein [Clavibacter sp. Sh2126]|uniref:septum formation family protein n=1 Tax=Clavibacter sp. Sh2126 TaxID=3397678 RepID=UPI0039E05D10